ncbi:9728_t:CDS:2 [Ambispora leptoticha]|uniref:9728_t:CDS:1 n=1 Tax=Ambispora leptoticha TaxID=144679 RepID=A0A9N9C8E8_9GLOM|nr:9728_t:CDS:2 [Ambispora leptoticha]
MEPYKEETIGFAAIFDVLLKIAMVVGPVVGYFDQIASIRRLKSSAGFSIDTCGVLLISSIVRLFFWFGDRFDITLAYQSILMILVQLVLLYDCIKYRYPLSPGPNRRWFWNWHTYKSYILFMGVLTGVLQIFYLYLGEYDWFIQFLGYLALGIESTVPMPQAWENYQLQSVAGFRGMLGLDTSQLHERLRRSPSYNSLDEIL